MATPNKSVEDVLREWDKHYSLVAHKSLVSGDEADIEIKNWLRQAIEKKDREWVEKMKSIVPEEKEHKTQNTGNTYGQGKIEGWNACRQAIINNIKRL